MSKSALFTLHDTNETNSCALQLLFYVLLLEQQIPPHVSPSRARRQEAWIATFSFAATSSFARTRRRALMKEVIMAAAAIAAANSWAQTVGWKWAEEESLGSKGGKWAALWFSRAAALRSRANRRIVALKEKRYSERRCEVCGTFCHIMRRLLENPCSAL